MTKVTVEIECDTIDKIIVEQMAETMEFLKQDCEKRKKGNGFAVFEMDQDADVALMEEHIAAFKIILTYFGYKPE